MSIHLPGLPALFDGLFKGWLSGLRPGLAHRRPPLAPAGAADAQWSARCGTRLTLRRVCPQDAPLLGELFEDGLSSTSRRLRFHTAVRSLSPVQLAWLAGADFRRHAAFIVTRQTGGLAQAVAEGCWVRSGGASGAEFALSVADAWQHQGIGHQLLRTLVDTARAQDIACLIGDVLPGNLAMQALASSQRFDCAAHPDDSSLLRATLPLARRPQSMLSATWFH